MAQAPNPSEEASQSPAGVPAGLMRLGRWLQVPWTVLVTHWRNLTLATQFMLVSSVTVTAAMLVIGHWVTAKIENGVVNSAAAAAALYSDSLIEPHVQELVAGSQLSPENQSRLDRLLSPQAAGKPILAIKIWQGDTIVYSNRRELIGQRFPLDEARQRAWSGEVTATYGELDNGGDDVAERLLNLPILEIHAPVREEGTSRIIALAETYEIATALQQDLVKASIDSWLVVAGINLQLIALQLVIVMGGSRTIDAQRQTLSEQVKALTRLLAENEELRNRSHHANRRVTEINERFLRNLGAHLHDGPVQLLGLTQLRLGFLRKIVSNADPAIVKEAEEDFRSISEAVSESLEEIRNVAVGLVPPEIEKLELAAALQMAATRHQRRTRKEVICDIGELPDKLPLGLKSCLYRFAQEGLNNAFRHAGGLGQRLVADANEQRLEVSVMDEGPGIAPALVYDGVGGQGLLLLRDRIEALGGTFEISNRQAGGACLTTSFKLTAEDMTNG